MEPSSQSSYQPSSQSSYLPLPFLGTLSRTSTTSHFNINSSAPPFLTSIKDVVKLKSISNIYNDAIEFHIDISKWNTREVTNTLGLFENTNWFYSALPSSSTKLIDTTRMFKNASKFNKSTSGMITSYATSNPFVPSKCVSSIFPVTPVSLVSLKEIPSLVPSIYPLHFYTDEPSFVGLYDTNTPTSKYFLDFNNTDAPTSKHSNVLSSAGSTFQPSLVLSRKSSLPSSDPLSKSSTVPTSQLSTIPTYSLTSKPSVLHSIDPTFKPSHFPSRSEPTVNPTIFNPSFNKWLL